MNRYSLPLSFIVVMTVISCGKHDAPVTLAFERRSLTLDYGDCASDTSSCCRIGLEWPLLVNGTPAAADSVNGFSVGFVLSRLSGFIPESRRVAASPESLAQAFCGEYAAFRARFPDTAQQWWIEIQGEAVYVGDSAATLRMELSAYPGGAHPIDDVVYRSFDLKTGRTMRPEDIVTDNASLAALAEAVFRRVRGLAPDADLEESGFWFTDNRFALSDNFGLLGVGVVFYYNYYDIAPRYFGPTEVVLSWDDLDGILAPGFGEK